MNELVKKILEENLEARKNAVKEINTIAENVDIAKNTYDEALAKLAELGDVVVAKEKLITEIEEIENELFPSEDDDCSEFVADVAVATEEIAE